jgi:hypothetical protein
VQPPDPRGGEWFSPDRPAVFSAPPPRCDLPLARRSPHGQATLQSMTQSLRHTQGQVVGPSENIFRSESPSTFLVSCKTIFYFKSFETSLISRLSGSGRLRNDVRIHNTRELSHVLNDSYGDRGKPSITCTFTVSVEQGYEMPLLCDMKGHATAQGQVCDPGNTGQPPTKSHFPL